MNERTEKGRVGTVWGKWERGKDFGKWVTCGKYWRIRELKRQKGIVKCNWELKKMVQIVGNLEIYTRPYHKHSIRGPPFREFRLYQEKSHIFSSVQ